MIPLPLRTCESERDGLSRRGRASWDTTSLHLGLLVGGVSRTAMFQQRPDSQQNAVSPGGCKTTAPPTDLSPVDITVYFYNPR